MRTIIVVFSNNTKIDLKKDSTTKRYVFNTESDVNEGDVLDLNPVYSTKVIVDKVLDTKYKYYNKNTGELSNSIKSTNDFEIKVIKENTNVDDIIYFKKLSNE